MADEDTADTPAEQPEETPAEAPAPEPPAEDDDAPAASFEPPAEPEPAPEPSPIDLAPAAWPKEHEKFGYIWGTGRRKSSVARVRIRPGEGKFLVNERPYSEYFTSERERVLASAALVTTKRDGHYDVFVRTDGGGTTGQAGAVLLGTARALKIAEPALEPVLREQGHLTRDSRQKERKKYGRRGARRSFQFSKR